ncbi:MAG: type II toxin-antitoxin system MqsA family antitoxin [Moorea sp. SIO2B7]|nr:type II toxin-antitoxin system MqsA family antitoxin [Moorena sp. SIO2B7]
MKCVICKHGDTEKGLVTVTLERDSCLIILKQVPADICQNCGEYYLSESVTDEVLKRAENAMKKGAELEIMRYVA